MMTIRIRDATEGDLPAILAIYNDAVAHSTATWNETPVDLANRRAWWKSRSEAGLPVLVAESAGAVLGYASYGPFRPFDGYRLTAEHSIYVTAEARRRGIGASLLTALEARARNAGLHVLVGGIGADNEASILMHAKHGFTETGRLPEVGRKFGRYLDLVFMQKRL